MEVPTSAFAALDPIAFFGLQVGPRDARRVEMATGPFAEDDGPVMSELSETRPLGQRAQSHGRKPLAYGVALVAVFGYCRCKGAPLGKITKGNQRVRSCQDRSTSGRRAS